MKCNRPNWKVVHDDISNITSSDLEEYFDISKGELDLLSGRAHCQAASYTWIISKDFMNVYCQLALEN